MLTKLSNNALVCRMFSSLGGNMVYLYKYPGYVIYASIHWEKDVIFLGLIMGQIDRPVPVVINGLVSDLSYIYLCLQTWLWETKQNSMNTPRIM